MKQKTNFRLNSHAVVHFEKTLPASETPVIQDNLQDCVAEKLSNKNLLLACAGILSDKQASSMLTGIKSSRKNKKVVVGL